MKNCILKLIVGLAIISFPVIAACTVKAQNWVGAEDPADAIPAPAYNYIIDDADCIARGVVGYAALYSDGTETITIRSDANEWVKWHEYAHTVDMDINSPTLYLYSTTPEWAQATAHIVYTSYIMDESPAELFAQFYTAYHIDAYWRQDLATWNKPVYDFFVAHNL